MKNRIFAGIVAVAVAVTMMFGTAATVFAEGGGSMQRLQYHCKRSLSL